MTRTIRSVQQKTIRQRGSAVNPLLELPTFTSPVFAYSAHEDDTGLLFEDGAKAVPATDDNDPVYTMVQVPSFGAVDGVQATTANRALLRTGANGINGHNALSFDGVNDFYTLTGITAASGAKTFYAVYDPLTAVGTLQDLFDTQTGRLIVAHLTSTSGKTGYFESAWRDIGDATASPQIMCWALGSGTGTMYRNGTSIGSAAYADKAIGGTVALGSNMLTTAQFFGGLFGAIYCDNALHDAAKRAQMFAYLSQQWDIAVS